MTKAHSPPDARRFRDTIGLFATGVAVVVARADQEVLAMTVNAVSSVSLEPMLVMFCPGKKSNMARHIAGLSGFSINILRHDQQALSTYFAGGWKEPTPPPFRLVPSQCAPRLEGSLASIGCEPHQVIEVGDHWIVIGKVMDLHTGIHPHRPLLFVGGRYRHVDSSESAPAPDLTNVHDEPAHIYYE
jgi:flavin reductase (DIM6/NTAB) family NADH-FMN oxidoreductase RutF